MGILDDAIRDHLDLKRQHGAREDEVRSLEDAAFGSGDRPDPFADGELFGKPTPPAPGGVAGDEEPTRVVEPQASAQAPPVPEAPPAPEAPETQAPLDGPEPSPSGAAGLAPPAPQEAEQTEHEAAAPPLPEPETPPAEPPPLDAAPQQQSSPEALRDERELPLPAPAEPQAGSESLADLIAEDEEEEPEPSAHEPPPPPPDTAEVSRPEDSTMIRPPEPPEPRAPAQPSLAPDEAEVPSVEVEPPSDEMEPPPVGAEPSEPEPTDEALAASGVPDPPPPPPAPGTEPPGRARGRVHHATEEHPAPEPDSREIEQEGPPSSEPLEPASAPSGVFDFETEGSAAEMSLGGAAAEPEAEAPAAEARDDFDDLGPPTDEQGYADDEQHTDEERPPQAPAESAFDESSDNESSDEHPPTEVRPADTSEEDLLAGSPDFVEESDEDEDLWFEQGPPKDFDFEDEK